MNSVQLNAIMMNYSDTATSQAYKGVFPVDKFVENVGVLVNGSASDKSIFFINTEPSNSTRSMGHWVMVQIGPGDKAIFFDSFNKHPSFYNTSLWNVLQELSSVESAPYRVQSDTSHLCGLYCVYVAQNLESYGNNLEHIIRQNFSPTSLTANDASLIDWVSFTEIGHLFRDRCAKKDSECISYSDLLM